MKLQGCFGKVATLYKGTCELKRGRRIEAKKTEDPVKLLETIRTWNDDNHG